jgi:hypothetical protein
VLLSPEPPLPGLDASKRHLPALAPVIGLGTGYGLLTVEKTIWAWHWARPDDERVPWQRGRRLDLPPDTQRAKVWALPAFTSQTQPRRGETILPPHVLARFDRPFETAFA